MISVYIYVGFSYNFEEICYALRIDIWVYNYKFLFIIVVVYFKWFFFISLCMLWTLLFYFIVYLVGIIDFYCNAFANFLPQKKIDKKRREDEKKIEKKSMEFFKFWLCLWNLKFSNLKWLKYFCKLLEF